ncbi:unannotated protein [freshwater metagenome]|uniref:Unannotated protein n=1 Tax=freshwater metagenome TaxID=449393 RepID=A0A6J7E3K1_9ZZZZ
MLAIAEANVVGGLRSRECVTVVRFRGQRFGRNHPVESRWLSHKELGKTVTDSENPDQSGAMFRHGKDLIEKGAGRVRQTAEPTERIIGTGGHGEPLGVETIAYQEFART